MPLYSGPDQRGFNIGAFRAVRNIQGIIRTHDFHIVIPWPEGLPRDPALVGVHRTLELACDSCNFPTTALQTYAVQRYGYGTLETKPVLPQFGRLETSFMTDQYTNIWRFLHSWMRLAVNYQFWPNQVGPAIATNFEISYTREYAVDIYLHIYDPYGHLVRLVGFRQAYPVTIGDVNFAWGQASQMARIPVQFAFFDWKDELVPALAPLAQPPPNPVPLK